MTGLVVNPLPWTIDDAAQFVEPGSRPAARSVGRRNPVAVICRTAVVYANRARLVAELEHELRAALGKIAGAGRG